MLLAGVSAILSYVFGSVAWRSAPRGWQFLRLGWALIEPYASSAEGRRDVNGRRAISEGGNYVLAGGAWLVASIISAGMALFFFIQTLVFSGLLDTCIIFC